MNIVQVTAEKEKAAWNLFVKQHYPPIGAFMQTWEWGEFQKALGRTVGRHAVTNGKKRVAQFSFAEYPLPLGFCYGYSPRGPVVATSSTGDVKFFEILDAIRTWTQKTYPHLIFFRFEPPLPSVAEVISDLGFSFPSYYIQPRHNHVVSLERTEDEILAGFHSSTRSNIKRAERRSVSVAMQTSMSEADYRKFFAMAKETSERNSGTNFYPSESYLRSFVKTIPAFAQDHDSCVLSLAVYVGYQHREPAAIHFVLFFGDTATYLYGASYTDMLRSKVTTYLHWAAMQEAKRRGLKYYDLGGVDEERWPTLTNFKRQFRGREVSYMGNIDISIRPVLHWAYNFFRKVKKPN